MGELFEREPPNLLMFMAEVLGFSTFFPCMGLEAGSMIQSSWVKGWMRDGVISCSNRTPMLRS